MTKEYGNMIGDVCKDLLGLKSPKPLTMKQADNMLHNMTTLGERWAILMMIQAAHALDNGDSERAEDLADRAFQLWHRAVTKKDAK